MAAVYYPPAASVPFNQAGLVQSDPAMVSPPSSNFFVLPTTTTATMPYSEGFISPPTSSSIPTAIHDQSSVSISAPGQLPSDDIVTAFGKLGELASA